MSMKAAAAMRIINGPGQSLELDVRMNTTSAVWEDVIGHVCGECRANYLSAANPARAGAAVQICSCTALTG